MSPKHVVIVEDDPDLAASLSRVINGASEFELSSVSSSAEELLVRLATTDPPDIALVDLGLPGLSGQQLIAELKRLYPAVACVAHTVFEDRGSLLAALRAGACGYLVKGVTAPELVQSLNTLEQGGAPLTPRMARLLTQEFQVSSSPLSDRELEVLDLLGQGYSYKQCASQLTVSVHTVHDHVKRIYGKLGVHSKREAVDKARRQGWLKKNEGPAPPGEPLD